MKKAARAGPPPGASISRYSKQIHRPTTAIQAAAPRADDIEAAHL